MKISYTVSLIGWMSVFLMSWMLILNTVQPTATSWFFWSFFLLTALVASAAASSPQKPGVGRKV